MPNLNPEAAFESMKARMAEALRAQFPFEGKDRRLELLDLTFDERAATPDDPHHIDNIEAQYKARTEGGPGSSWGVPIRARLRLVDKATGAALDEQVVTLARLPKLTRRYSYIVEGQERQHDSVFRSKPRPYHRITASGEIQGRWNLAKGAGFDLDYDPRTGLMTMHVGTSNAGLYAILRVLGVSDEAMVGAWGADIFDQNKKKAKVDRDIDKVFKALRLRLPGHQTEGTTAQKAERLRAYFEGETEVWADAMKDAFGKPYTNVNGENLLLSSKRLVSIQRGRDKEDPPAHETPDDRQALSSKYLTTTEDFLVEAIRHAEGDIKKKIYDRIDKPQYGVTDILSPNTYNKVILGKFSGAQRPDQTNPLQFLSGHTRTTIRGKDFGGVGSDKINLDVDKQINPTHLGFLDPIQSPESEDTGIALHLPLGVSIARAAPIPGTRSMVSSGQDIRIRVYDTRAGSMVLASPAELEHAAVAYPDQVRWVGGKPQPIAPAVVCYDEARKTSKRPWGQVRYVLPSAKALFSFSANLIPFLQNNSGNRAMTAAKQQEQAVSLVRREQPLVQVKTDGAHTFENALGTFAAHFSPVAGTVTKVEPGAVHVADERGKTTRVQVYNHYPLNGGKGAMHAEPVVRPGQAVKKGDLLADTNFSKDGVLAMGTNLRVAYVPWKGLNFEDGIVVSERAAKQMASSHLHQLEATVYAGMVGAAPGARAKWVDYAVPERSSGPRMAKLDDRGIVKEGTVVNEGDVLVAILTPARATPEDEILSRIHKSLPKPFRDTSLVWDHSYPGKVVKVIVTEGTTRTRVSVHVATEEALVVGDKLTARHGNKGIVSRIVPDSQMPHTKDGTPVDILLNPAGVPSRMNIGQVLETAASKIAEKTGKPYLVENFSPGVDYAARVKRDLAAHGLSDTEELFDPETGRSIGQILTGKQYMLKLHHMVEKKMTARSFGHGYTSSGEAPSGSGIPGGGQKMDMLSTYSMLAHGAGHNLREAYTFKADEDQNAVWGAVMTGRALPPPEPTRGMKNFLDYMRAMGINTAKHGDEYTLMPMTDAHLLGDKARGIVGISNGEIKLPEKSLLAKDMKTVEEMGGLFDPKVTGGMQGKFWGHVKLAERMPNPVFESAIQVLTGTTKKQYDALVGDKLGPDGKSGFHSIVAALSKIDVDAEIAKEKARLPSLTRSPLSVAVKRLRYLEALKANNMTPLEAYTNQYVPVLPPSVRRVSVGLDGTQVVDDRNYLYLGVGQANAALKNAHPSLPPSELQKSRAHLYRTLRDLRVTGGAQSAGKPRHYTGLMELLSGKVQKSGAPKDCYDDQTEILTQRGWVLFRDLEEGAPVATVNLQTEEFEWQVPTKYVRQQYSGPMVHTKRRDIDLLVTPNHRHVLKTLRRKGNSRSGVSARYWPSDWEIGTADSLLGQNKRRMLTAARAWNGSMRAYSFDGDCIRDAEAFAWLVGLWVAEGWWTKRNGAELSVSSVGMDLANKIEATLLRAGLSFKDYQYEKTVDLDGKTHEFTELRWRFTSRAFGDWLRDNAGVGAQNKRLSPEILAWSDSQLRALLAGFLAGDGCTRNVGLGMAGTTYKRRDPLAGKGGLNTTSERLIDDLQHLCAKVGLRFTKRGSYQPKKAGRSRVYTGGLLGYGDVDVSFASKQVQYTGEIFCVVVPNTTVIVRRNGLPVVSGNSYFQDKVLARRQDLSGRSTIVPEPALHLDQVGLPIPVALEMYRPFVVRELVREGKDPLVANKLVSTKKDDPQVLSALERAVASRPTLLKRDPSLHKFSIMAFEPKLMAGSAIRIHPLVTGGFNADFDGDQMLGAVFLLMPAQMFNADVTTWEPRRVLMTARVREAIGYLDGDDVLVTCDLADFPHTDLLRTKGHIDFFAVPEGLRVVALDEHTGRQGLYEVRAWSVHRDRVVEVVTLGSGRQIITDDDDRAVFGVDADTLRWCRRRPREASEQYVPVLDEAPLPERDARTASLDKLRDRDDRLRPLMTLDARAGYFFGAMVGDGWVTGAGGRNNFVCFSSSYDDVQARWEESLLCAFARPPVVTDTETIDGLLEGSRGSWRAVVSCVAFGEFVASLIGKGAQRKHLPPFFLRADAEFCGGLLSGLWDTDGSFNWSSGKNKPQFQASYSSTSIRLVQEVQYLLRTFAVAATITPSRTPAGEPFWVLTVSTPDLYEALTENRLVISPAHAAKRAALQQFVEGPPPDRSGAYSRYRLVPLPPALAADLRKIITHSANAGVYASLSKALQAVPRKHVSKELALRVLDLVGDRCTHPLYADWAALVRNPTIHFEQVTGYERTDIEETGFDLTVPGADTFAALDGVVLSNTMALYVPVSEAAVEEARGMLPSKNLFSPTHFKLMPVPGQDSLLGLYQVTKWGSEVKVPPGTTRAKVIEMAEHGKIKPTDVVTIDGKKTTPGRLALADHLPAEMRNDERLLHDASFVLDKGNLQAILTRVGKNHEREYAHVVDAWKDVGNKMSFLNGSSFSINDFHDGREFRESVLAKYRKREEELHATPMSGPRRDREIVKIYTDARNELEELGKKRYNGRTNRVWEWAQAKARGDWNQFSQLVVGPMLVQDSRKRTVPVPITRSYGEGLSVSEYWASMHGARKGTLDRVQGTREPGAVTKDIINTVMNLQVTAEDCGSTDGVRLSPKDPDVTGRYLAQAVKVGGEDVPAGQLVDGALAARLATAGVDRVVVRSPLHCRMPKGICAKCFGKNERDQHHAVGTNIGILAGHALGEPITQLAMRTFHTGGAAGTGSAAVDSFQRVKQLFDIPEKLPNAATLAAVSGTVDQVVSPDPLGGHTVFVDGHAHRVVTGKLLDHVRVGAQVKKGDVLSTGPVNPHDLLTHTRNVGRVRDYMTSELMHPDLYGGLGVRRRNVETVVRGMTNLAEVTDAPANSPYRRGQLVPLSELAAHNAEAAAEDREEVGYAPRLRPMDQSPLAGQEDWLARLNYQRLKETYTEGAQQSWKSNIHKHPIPGLAHGAEFGLRPAQAIKPPPARRPGAKR